jgi:hypothetical protein
MTCSGKCHRTGGSWCLLGVAVWFCQEACGGKGREEGGGIYSDVVERRVVGPGRQWQFETHDLMQPSLVGRGLPLSLV